MGEDRFGSVGALRQASPPLVPFAWGLHDGWDRENRIDERIYS